MVYIETVVETGINSSCILILYRRNKIAKSINFTTSIRINHNCIKLKELGVEKWQMTQKSNNERAVLCLKESIMGENFNDILQW